MHDILAGMEEFFEVRNEIKIVLDREKIEREGEYDYDDLVEYLDTEFADQGFIRQPNEECLCYCSDETNNLLKQVVCYARVVDEPAVYDNLKSWHIAEYRNNDFVNPVMMEDVLETIAADGDNP